MHVTQVDPAGCGEYFCSHTDMPQPPHAGTWLAAAPGSTWGS